MTTKQKEPEDCPFGVIPLLGGAETVSWADEERHGQIELSGETYELSTFTGPASASPFPSDDQDIYRPQLELVIIVDTSASMAGPVRIDSLQHEFDERDLLDKPKRIEVVQNLLYTLFSQLKPPDKLSLLSYNDTPDPLISLQEVRIIDSDTFQETINTLSASAGTDMYEAIEQGVGQFPEPRKPPKGTERRMLLLTDSKPVLNDQDETYFDQQVTDMSYLDTYLTLGGVGSGISHDDIQPLTDLSGFEAFDIN